MSTSPLADLADQTAALLASIAELDSIDAMRDAEPFLVGKRSPLTILQKSLGALDPGERKDAGARLTGWTWAT
jgi:hypothetical protein